MPHGLRLQEEYGDDLVVLFVEVQKTSPEDTFAFALGRKWLGGRAIWTNERPFDPGFKGIPKFALLDARGEVVLAGYTNRLQSELDDAIEELVRGVRKGPDDVPRAVAKAWAEMGKRRYAKALGLCEEVIAEGHEDQVAAARELGALLEARVASELRRIDWMLENGFPLEAQALHEELEQAVDGGFGIAEALDALESRLASDQLAQEISAAKALAKVEHALYDGAKSGDVRALEKLVEKYGGTKVALRGRDLLVGARLAVD